MLTLPERDFRVPHNPFYVQITISKPTPSSNHGVLQFQWFYPGLLPIVSTLNKQMANFQIMVAGGGGFIGGHLGNHP